MTPTSPKKPAKTSPAAFRAVKFVEVTLHDPIRDGWEAGCDEGGVRLYCTSHPATHGKKNGR